MEQIDLEPLRTVFYRRLATVQTTFKRYLYNQIDWRDRLIGIPCRFCVLFLHYGKKDLHNSYAR